MRTSFEPARSFANPLDFQDQLDRWSPGGRTRAFTAGSGAVPAERLIEERQRMRPLPEPMPQTALRSVLRVPQQPLFRFDTNDYSLDPRFAGRRVELTIGQHQITAMALDSGELCARHNRSFAKHLTFTDPAHQAQLDRLRGDRRRAPRSMLSCVRCLAMTG